VGAGGQRKAGWGVRSGVQKENVTRSGSRSRGRTLASGTVCSGGVMCPTPAAPFRMSLSNLSAVSRMPIEACVRVGAPLIPLVALVELPPRKGHLSRSRTRPPCSSTVCAALRPARPPPMTMTCSLILTWMEQVNEWRAPEGVTSVEDLACEKRLAASAENLLVLKDQTCRVNDDFSKKMQRLPPRRPHSRARPGTPGNAAPWPASRRYPGARTAPVRWRRRRTNLTGSRTWGGLISSSRGAVM
jgi:hypothetical protein